MSLLKIIAYRRTDLLEAAASFLLLGGPRVSLRMDSARFRLGNVANSFLLRCRGASDSSEEEEEEEALWLSSSALSLSLLIET